MKIYINNYNMVKITKKLKNIAKYLTNKKNYIEIYTDEGVYSVDQHNIYKFTYLDKSIQTIEYNPNIENNPKFELLIDVSETKLDVVNHLPFNNLIVKMQTNTYKLKSNSKTKLIVQFMLEQNMEYKLYNFYFVVSDDIDINSLSFKEDINVFLFHLN